jgi:hypothetical protein
MKKLNKEQTEAVEAFREYQMSIAAEDENRYNSLLELLQLDDATHEDFIFDYIYNSGGSSDEYMDFIKQNVFGDDPVPVLSE